MSQGADRTLTSSFDEKSPHQATYQMNRCSCNIRQDLCMKIVAVSKGKTPLTCLARCHVFHRTEVQTLVTCPELNHAVSS